VTRTQESFRQSLSELRREVSTSSGREAFIPVLRPPTSIIPKDNLFLLATRSPRQSFHTPCNSFLRLRTFRELSLSENFSSATDFSPRALISELGLLERAQLLFRHHPRFPYTPSCAEMLPDPRGQTPSAGRGLPSVLAVNPGSTGPTPLLKCSTWWTAPRSRYPYVHTQAARSDSYAETPDFYGKPPPAEFTREHGSELREWPP
jgi:hypothetical protein